MANPVTSARWYALRDIDDAAGMARLRFITDVAGQQAVYMVKLQQAQAYAEAVALDAQAPAPPYIAAEASATGETPGQVTAAILALAAVWNEQVGPAIEGARMGGKAAVGAVADPDPDNQEEVSAALAAVATARAAAVAALEQIKP